MRTLPWPDFIPELKTERLVLRPLGLDDAPDVAALFSDPAVTRFIDLDPMGSVADARAAIAEVLTAQENQRAMRWAIRVGASNELAGTVGLLNISARNGRAELGYDLGRAYWGRGLAREAAAEVVDYGFDAMGLHRIEADVQAENKASIAVLEKLGFRYEADLHDYLFMKGSYHDVRRYYLLSS